LPIFFSYLLRELQATKEDGKHWPKPNA
jgi:hypothetical protein